MIEGWNVDGLWLKWHQVRLAVFESLGNMSESLQGLRERRALNAAATVAGSEARRSQAN